MILSNQDIRKALDDGLLEISPRPQDDQYTTSAVDLFIGDDFRVWDKRKFQVSGVKVELNLAEQKFQQTAQAFLVPQEPEADGCVVFHPHSVSPVHMLAITRERVHLKPGSRLAARVEGRSSLARLGLVVHLTAPTIHAGFNGHITLEMINFGPFYLKFVPHQTRICQLIVEQLASEPQGDISTSFQGQTGPSGQR